MPFFSLSHQNHQVRALIDGCNHREGYDEGELQWESAHEQRQHELKIKKMEDRLREQAERFRQAMTPASHIKALDDGLGEPSTATASNEMADEVAALAAEAAAAGDPVDDGAGGGRRKRRAAAAKVDYVALAKKMKEEEKGAAAGEGEAAGGSAAPVEA